MSGMLSEAVAVAADGGIGEGKPSAFQVHFSITESEQYSFFFFFFDSMKDEHSRALPLSRS